MNTGDMIRNRGATIVELMVTIVIVSILAATMGMFVVKLLTIQENGREEAYVREKLADICAAYADFLSIGSSVVSNNQDMIVMYRQETGGVSLETGRVSRVAYLTSSIDTREKIADRTLDLKIYANDEGAIRQMFSRRLSGDALLVPFKGDLPDIVSCTLTLLKTNSVVCQALGYLQIAAKYEVENDDGSVSSKIVTAGRIVRLWNRE